MAIQCQIVPVWGICSELQSLDGLVVMGAMSEYRDPITAMCVLRA